MITSLLIAYGAFNSIIHGAWYEREYINDVRRTHSPYLSQNSLAGIVELDIDTANFEGDSLEVGAPGIHGGFSFKITFNRGHTTNAVPTNLGDLYQDDHHYELGYAISKHDTTLILYAYDERYVLVQETKYKRVRSGPTSALQFMVNKTLFSGEYTVIDSTGNRLSGTFTDDGLVAGIPKFTQYYVLTDFVAGPVSSVDQVCFNIQTANQRCYAYEIRGDRIRLYNTTEADDRVFVNREKAVYTLIRRRSTSR